MIDEAGSRKAKGQPKCRIRPIGGRAMGISKEVRTKIPHDWEVQSWGNLMYSSEEQTDAILLSCGRL